MKKETGIVLYCYLPFSVAGNIFILKNSLNEFFYIKDHPFYKKNNIKIFIDYRDTDSLSPGEFVEFTYQVINGENIVTDLKWGTELLSKVKKNFGTRLMDFFVSIKDFFEIN